MLVWREVYNYCVYSICARPQSYSLQHDDRLLDTFALATAVYNYVDFSKYTLNPLMCWKDKGSYDQIVFILIISWSSASKRPFNFYTSTWYRKLGVPARFCPLLSELWYSLTNVDFFEQTTYNKFLSVKYFTLFLLKIHLYNLIMVKKCFVTYNY